MTVLFFYTAPPVITLLPSDQTAVQPNTALFTCTSSGFPHPIIQWWRRTLGSDLMLLSNSSQFLINEVVFGVRKRTSHLTLLQTSINDSGNYTCTAENAIGSVNSTARLIVYGRCSSKGLFSCVTLIEYAIPTSFIPSLRFSSLFPFLPLVCSSTSH